MAWTTPRTWTPGEVVTATLLNQHLRDNLVSVLPVGSLVYRVAAATAVETVVENRFLECNGVAVSRTTYASLFSYLSGLSPTLPFGTGDGSTTFNIPDFRARLPVGAGGSGAKSGVSAIGANDGLAYNLRHINHRHSYTSGDPGSQGRIGQNNTLNLVTRYTDGDADNTNQPAYLVGGVWYIKYTS